METKQEFLDVLRRALTGKISSQEIEEYIRYYDDYITAETRKKGFEKQVLESLGNPRLIAMSICAANDAQARDNGGYGATEDVKYAEESQADANNRESKKDDRPFIFRHPKLTIGVVIAVIILLLVLVIWLAFSLLSFFWPVIVAVVVIGILVRFIAYIGSHWQR